MVVVDNGRAYPSHLTMPEISGYGKYLGCNMSADIQCIKVDARECVFVNGKLIDDSGWGLQLVINSCFMGKRELKSWIKKQMAA
jgi:hypothetical protein